MQNSHIFFAKENSLRSFYSFHVKLILLGITMVMVTHDVALKNFANRVIWMRDGKIQHVEEISKEKREKRIDELNKEYEEIKKGKKMRRDMFMNTVVRQPTDYKTHPNYKKAGMKPFFFCVVFGLFWCRGLFVLPAWRIVTLTTQNPAQKVNLFTV